MKRQRRELESDPDWVGIDEADSEGEARAERALVRATCGGKSVGYVRRLKREWKSASVGACGKGKRKKRKGKGCPPRRPGQTLGIPCEGRGSAPGSQGGLTGESPHTGLNRGRVRRRRGASPSAERASSERAAQRLPELVDAGQRRQQLRSATTIQ